MPEVPLGTTWRDLAARGWLRADAFEGRGDELAAVRSVAAGGLGAGRVFDGHRNALERLLVHRAEDIDAELRAELATGSLALGVWGAEPGPGDGAPAVLDDVGATVTGAKAFCSGAGHVDLAIVLVRRHDGAPPTLPVLIDVRDAQRVRVDRGWFASPALAESHSHHVEFDHAPVVATLGTEGTLTVDPWFSGDALRSTAVWAGGADTILDRLVETPPADAAAEERLGRAVAIIATVDVWLAAALGAVDDAHRDGTDPARTVGALRLELTERIRELLRIAAEHRGSRSLATDTVLGEARSGLDLLLLQHRLGPVAARLGRQGAEEAAR